MTPKSFPIGLSTCGNKPLDEKSLLAMKASGIDYLKLSKLCLK